LTKFTKYLTVVAHMFSQNIGPNPQTLYTQRHSLK